MVDKYTTLPLRKVALGLFVMAMLSVFLLWPGAREAASGLLSIFRAQRFAPVTFDPSSTTGIRIDPSAFGTFTGSEPSPQPVASLEEAAKVVDFPIRSPAYLPGSLVTAGQVSVVRTWGFEFTFDAAKTRAALEALGASAIALPANLDGATVKASLPAQVIASYETGPQALFFSQGRAPSVELPDNVDAASLREFFLNIPGLPPSVLSQLRAIPDWQSTVPIPIPQGSESRSVPVDGVEGLLITGPSSSSNSAALLWQKNGIVYALGGAIGQEELLKVAASFK